MGGTDKGELRQKQVNEIYQAIGEFAVKFEEVCFSIQNCIIFLLEKEGLKKQSISQILTSGLTAGPLIDLFVSLTNESEKPMSELQKIIINNSAKRFIQLFEDRNKIIHNNWFIGYGNTQTTDYSEAHGLKYCKNKEGSNPKSVKFTAEDFKQLSEKCEDLINIFFWINISFFCYPDDNHMGVFQISPEGVVSIPAKNRRR